MCLAAEFLDQDPEDTHTASEKTPLLQAPFVILGKSVSSVFPSIKQGG